MWAFRKQTMSRANENIFTRYFNYLERTAHVIETEFVKKPYFPHSQLFPPDPQLLQKNG